MHSLCMSRCFKPEGDHYEDRPKSKTILLQGAEGPGRFEPFGQTFRVHAPWSTSAMSPPQFKLKLLTSPLEEHISVTC